MLTIYSIPLSLYCAKLRILLRHKDLEWQEIPPPGGYGSGEYKQIIPSGNLPALIDEKLVLADSEAIAEYLNEKHPQPAMLPDNIEQRARARQRSRFHDTRLEPEVRKLFPLIDETKRDNAIIKKQSLAICERLQQFSRSLVDDGLSINSQLTLGDCGFPITFAWIEALIPILNIAVDWPDSITAYKNNVNEYEAVKDELTSYQACLHQWLGSQTN